MKKGCDTMIHRLAESIAFFYSKNASYTSDEIEVCTYGLELIISDIIVVFITIIVSLMTDTILYTLLLLVVFITLRHRAGGFHASSHMRCNIIYFIAYTCFLAGIKYIPDDIVKYIVIAICILGFLSIYQYAPVAHPNKPVSVLKKNKFRKQSIILEVLFASGAIILLFVFSNMEKYALSIVGGIMYTALAVMIEAIKQKCKSTYN